ncbi:MAG: sigma-54-dependent Fis family transcriptional regulator [Spirochaetales bacterium]|nr:sigma-54-dependent Fis family transcriptional regulator [Spirochaetales bacterium]
MKLFPENPVLIIDDEVTILDGQKTVLQSEGINNIICVSESQNVKQIMQKQAIDVVLLDLTMPVISGQEILNFISGYYPGIPVIVITGTNDITEAVECMKDGAFDYMVKSVEKSRLISGVKRAIEYRLLERENRKLRSYLLTNQVKQPEAFSNIITNDKQMHQLFAYAELIADSSEPVLITGETGVGKELFAEAIHSAGKSKGEFVAVNVAGIDDLTFSDTLFGHRKGAYTGAIEARQGLLQQARGGTILLDEIGDLSKESQVKLLRLIDNGEYYALGSDVPRKSEARIIAITNKNMEKMVKSGAFRKDLFYRLDTHSIFIPPFRERLEDLPLLIDHFLMNKDITHRTELISLLTTYNFPGNIRELRALLIDSVRRSTMGGTLIEIIQRKLNLEFSPAAVKLNEQQFLSDTKTLPTLKQTTELLISEAMKRAHGNQTSAASLLGISKQALNKRLLRNNQKTDY